MVCPKCGEELSYSAKFCDACGYNLEEENKKDTGGAKVYSGKEDNYFEFSSGVPATERRELKKPKKNRKGQWISLVLVLSMAVIFGLVGLFVYGHVHKSEQEKPLYQALKLINNKETSYNEWIKVLYPEFLMKDAEEFDKAICKDTDEVYEDYVSKRNIQFSESMDSIFSSVEMKIDYDIKSERKLGKEELEDVRSYNRNYSTFMNTNWNSSDTKTLEDYKAANQMNTYNAYKKMLEDYASMDVTEGYEMNVEFKISEKKSKEEMSQTVTLRVIKAEGEWMLDYAYVMEKMKELVSDMNLF